ncbi:MAG: hypothetical protein E4H01_11535, partial [Lysobacterales bacterium]
LIIVDTLARTFAGGNENSSEDMGAFIAIIDYLREKTDSAILAVHHSGKDTSRGTRGHSSLFGAVDAEFEVRKVRTAPAVGPGQGAGTFSVTKQKDGLDGWSADFVAEKMLFPREPSNQSMEDDVDSEGQSWADDDERSSLAVRAYRPDEARVVMVEEARLSMKAHAALRILKAMCARGDGKARMGNWSREARAAGIVGEGSDKWATLRKEMKAAGCYSTIDDRFISVGDAFQLSDWEEKQEEGGKGA